MAFDGARTHDLHIMSQTCNPLRHAAPLTTVMCENKPLKLEGKDVRSMLKLVVY